MARAAGYTKGAVYSRFRDKAALFLAVLEEGIAARIAALEAGPSPDGDLAERLVDGWERTVREDEGWFLAVLEFRVHAARHADLNQRYGVLHERLVAHLARLLTRLHPRPAAAGAVARSVLALGSGMALEAAQGADPDPESGRAAVRALIERGVR